MRYLPGLVLASTLLTCSGCASLVSNAASDFADNINGQTFLVYGDTISLVSQPRPERAIYEPSGTWDMDKLSQMARDVLTKDIPNPAPAREPS